MLDLNAKFNLKSKFTLFRTYPYDHSPPNEVRISELGPIIHLCIFNIPINFGFELLKSSISFLPLSPLGWRGIVILVRVAGRAAVRFAEPISL